MSNKSGYIGPYRERQVSLSTYIKQKIKILKSELYLKLSEEEEKHFYELKSDIEVDNYAHSLIAKKL